MLAVEDAGTHYPQAFRRVCSAGEPLKPEAIRWFREQYGLTVLDRCRTQLLAGRRLRRGGTVVLGDPERLCDLPDGSGLLVLHPALGLRCRRCDVEHQATIGVELVRGFGVEHCHRGT
jgi:hypothetical protein